MTTPLTTTLEVTLTLHLTGEYQDYVPASGPTYSSGGEPASGGFCEDLAIDHLTISIPHADTAGLRTWTELDLLAGIDTSTASIQQFLGTLLSAVEEDAQDALASVAGDVDDDWTDEDRDTPSTSSLDCGYDEHE